VVKAARQALATGDPSSALIWVGKSDEPALRDAFQKTLAMRKLGPEARDFADNWFFETLVRLHRAAEGAPYTGLKPAGGNHGPAIPAADQALADGSPGRVISLLTEALHHGALERFQSVHAKKKFRKDDVDAGREYVKAYVEFVHYVHGVFQAAHAAGHRDE
jgi:hypothetical protein